MKTISECVLSLKRPHESVNQTWIEKDSKIKNEAGVK